MTSKVRSTCKPSGAVCLLASFPLLIGVALAQVSSPPPVKAYTPAEDDAGDAMSRLKQGHFLPADIDLIAKARGLQAATDLKEQFELSQDRISKESIASALVKLGDKDPAWWDYLVQGAEEAIQSSAPSQARYDLKGKFMPGPSSNFVAWAKAHNLTTAAAIEAAMVGLPTHLVYLGKTGDRRAIPLLRQALLSPNVMIQTIAVRELSQFQDKASIPLIVAACQQAPADAAYAIASGLRLFDDPQAQSAAKEYAPLKDQR